MSLENGTRSRVLGGDRTNGRRRIGVVGTGVIGSGWVVRALARGLDVLAWDPAPGAEDRLRVAVDQAWPSATKLGLFPGADQKRLTWVHEVEELAGRVDWIQESAPENEDVKRTLLAALAAHSGPEVVIASSSSGLLPTRLQENCEHPERILIGHPFNPVYLLPLVEVVAGERTSPEAVEVAVAHYDDLVMYPLVVRTEIEGYLSDRLQEALWREILHLINDGVATTRELDDAVSYGPGLRWAGMGTNLTFHLAGGEQGMRHMLHQFGPALKLPWTRLEAPELTDELVEAMATGCEDQAEGRSIAELERLRDDYVIGVMRSLRPLNLGAGRLIAEREARIHKVDLGMAKGASWSPEDEVATPLCLYETIVEPDWVDYNDHMSEWAFLTAFGWASDKLFRYIGIDEDYRSAGHSFFTVETHLNYVKEASLGQPLRFTTQVLGFDAKRLHFFHQMFSGDDLLCTTEQMLLHVDTESGAVVPILPGPAAALAAISKAHANLPIPSQVGRVMTIPR
tara:strand:- start:314 stop:1849 length:1536 start_codon:yes stop_codon:yes gene_type:complete